MTPLEQFQAWEREHRTRADRIVRRLDKVLVRTTVFLIFAVAAYILFIK